MKTVSAVEQDLRTEMSRLSFSELKRFALDMGVEVEDVATNDREGVENACVAVEQYAFVH